MLVVKRGLQSLSRRVLERDYSLFRAWSLFRTWRAGLLLALLLPWIVSSCALSHGIDPPSINDDDAATSGSSDSGNTTGFPLPGAGGASSAGSGGQPGSGGAAGGTAGGEGGALEDSGAATSCVEQGYPSGGYPTEEQDELDSGSTDSTDSTGFADPCEAQE
jgi:hypothetical protein